MGVLLAACAARMGVLWVWSDNLDDDRDIYLALAEGVVEGRGFSVPGSDVPTAFRPPLYPLLLVATGTSDSPWGRGLLHLLLGTGTVWLTYVLGRRLRLRRCLALLAAALVAVDPLLLRYTTFPMTETLVTFLATALLVAITLAPSLRQQVLSGFLFGLCVLSRPTLWAFGGLMLLRGIVLRWHASRRNRTIAASKGRTLLPQGRESRRPANSRHGGIVALPRPEAAEKTQDRDDGRTGWPWVTLAVLAITVCPWVVRNMLATGYPILMTTHGGYTLLLGNNPAFYREVVEQPWGTVWDGSVGGGQAKWAESLNREMDNAGITGEVARDRWMGRRAREHIVAEPRLFLRACLLRLRRFWSVTPGGTAAAALPSPLRVPLAVFYGATFLAAAVGFYRALRFDPKRWSPAILLLAAFVSVHLAYWSNARMRSPVVPVIALLAVRGVQRRPSGKN